eukprot:6364623-Pyramimonas_sp.AAC.1
MQYVNTMIFQVPRPRSVKGPPEQEDAAAGGEPGVRADVHDRLGVQRGVLFAMVPGKPSCGIGGSSGLLVSPTSGGARVS